MAMSGNTSEIRKRNYTFALHDPTQWQPAIDFVESCPGYAYIKHDDGDGEHYHFYIEFPNPQRLSSISKKLNIPSHMIEFTRNPEGLLFYLTHQDKKSIAAGKKKYSKQDIITNLPDSRFVAPLDKLAFWDKCVDLADDLRKGNITYKEYCRQLRLSLADTMTPVSIANFTFKVAMYVAPSSDDFEHVPISETPFADRLARGACHTCHVPCAKNEPKQGSMFPKYPT